MDEVDSVRVVQTIIDAFRQRDVERLVDQMTEDAIMEPSAFITGQGIYEGRQAIADGMSEMDRDLEESGERVQLSKFRHFVERTDPTVVLSLGFVTIVRASGEEFGTEVAYVWDLVGGRVFRLRTWLDHSEGQAQLSDPVEVKL